MNYLELLKKSDEFSFWKGANEIEIAEAENQLGVHFTKNYKIFLFQCGMCNFGDTNILGIAKNNQKTIYSVVDTTNEVRSETTDLYEDFIVLRYQVGEYVTLLKVAMKDENVSEDSPVYGSQVSYDISNKLKLSKPIELFDSFNSFFEDFLLLADEDEDGF